MKTQVEPTIICEYWERELPKALSDIELLIHGLLPGSVLRLGTVHPEALSEIPAWCQATGNNLIGRNQICEYPLGLQYFFDIERGDGNVHSSAMMTSEGM